MLMRFILGLIIGALLTLAVAHTTGLQPLALGAWVSRSVAALNVEPAEPLASADESFHAQTIQRETTQNEQQQTHLESAEPSAQPSATSVVIAPTPLDPIEAPVAPRPTVHELPLPVSAPQTVVASADTHAASIWVPFRSEMSARGFAARLQREIGREFHVSREGPGRYEVLFTYTDDAERRAVLDEVRAIAGYVAI